MENFKRMPLCELINLWIDTTLALPYFDFNQSNTQFFKRRLEIEERIAERFGFSHRDTLIVLGAKIKRIKLKQMAKENKAKCLAKLDTRMKDIIYQLEEININTLKLC